MNLSLLQNSRSIVEASFLFLGRGLGTITGKRFSHFLATQNHSRHTATRPRPKPNLTAVITSPILQHLAVFDQRRHYAMRQELTEQGIIWRRPEKIPSWTPEKAGDLEDLKKPDSSRLVPELTTAKDAYDQADDTTKKLLSIEFAMGRETRKVATHDFLRRVQRHKYDTGSWESKIAALTVTIRNCQDKMRQKRKQDIRLKVGLLKAIDHRKKLLKSLRKMDYKRFEWLLEELNLEYKNIPTLSTRITRKDSLRKLVQMYKDDLIEQRMKDYRLVLESQKEDFLKEKEETLKWIAKVQEELGIPVDEEAKDVAKSKS